MEENLMKRVLPHSIEAEQSVIGSMLMDRTPLLQRLKLLQQMNFTSTSTASCLRQWWSCLTKESQWIW